MIIKIVQGEAMKGSDREPGRRAEEAGGAVAGRICRDNGRQPSDDL